MQSSLIPIPLRATDSAAVNGLGMRLHMYCMAGVWSVEYPRQSHNVSDSHECQIFQCDKRLHDTIGFKEAYLLRLCFGNTLCLCVIELYCRRQLNFGSRL